MIFGLLYLCVVILCVNRSRSRFILYRIVKRHSRHSNVRRIWTCADNGKNSDGLLIFAQNSDCGYTLEPPVLTSTHNLCFRAKIRKNVYPSKPQFYYIKVGCKGVYITQTCYHDVK